MREKFLTITQKKFLEKISKENKIDIKILFDIFIKKIQDEKNINFLFTNNNNSIVKIKDSNKNQHIENYLDNDISFSHICILPISKSNTIKEYIVILFNDKKDFSIHYINEDEIKDLIKSQKKKPKTISNIKEFIVLDFIKLSKLLNSEYKRISTKQISNKSEIMRTLRLNINRIKKANIKKN
jgi:hypothetical protein